MGGLGSGELDLTVATIHAVVVLITFVFCCTGGTWTLSETLGANAGILSWCSHSRGYNLSIEPVLLEHITYACYNFNHLLIYLQELVHIIH